MKFEADDVACYLKDHPEFFEQHAALLAEIYLPHPHGGRTISISERQQLALRDKNNALENKLRELIRFGEENDAIGDKVHRLSLALIMARDLDSALHRLYFNLREDFAVPHVALRLWRPARSAEAPHPEFADVGRELRAFAENLANPLCGAHPLHETDKWFGEDGPRLRSFAFAALRAEHAFGLLVFASEDGGRFYPEMGTLYLKRIGELASAALLPYLEETADAA